MAKNYLHNCFVVRNRSAPEQAFTWNVNEDLGGTLPTLSKGEPGLLITCLVQRSNRALPDAQRGRDNIEMHYLKSRCFSYIRPKSTLEYPLTGFPLVGDQYSGFLSQSYLPFRKSNLVTEMSRSLVAWSVWSDAFRNIVQLKTQEIYLRNKRCKSSQFLMIHSH